MNDVEWEEITLDKFPTLQQISSYRLWFDKNPNNVVFTIDEVFILTDRKTRLSRPDAYKAIKHHVEFGQHRLYRKIDVKADKEIAFLAGRKMPGQV